MPLHRLAPRLGLSLVATLLALLLGEWCLALAGVGAPGQGSSLRLLGDRIGADITVPDDDLLVRLAPGSSFLGYYRVNSRGWRGAEPAASAPPGALRIVCVGDSCTFGFGLDESLAWPSQLDAMLALAFEGAAVCDVVNTGVPGYSTWQNRWQVEHELAGLAPDLVVILPSGHNDITGARRFSDAERAAYNHSLRRQFEETRWYRGLSRLWSPRAADADTGTLPPGLPNLPWRVSPDETRANLAAMVSSVRGLDSAVLLLVPGHDPQGLIDTPAYASSAQLVAEMAARLGAPVVDVRPALTAWAPAVPFIDPVHPDARGSAEIAWAVFCWLVRSDGLLPDSPRRAWLAAWLDARAGQRHDLDWLDSGDGPPVVEQARVALRRAGPSVEAFRVEPSVLPAAVLAHDPLHGSERWHQLPGLVDLLGRVTSLTGDPEGGAALAARAQALAERQVPRTPQGLAGLELAADPGQLADARALLILEAMLRGPARPSDLRLEMARRTFEAGQNELALAHVEAAAELNPDDAQVLLLKGQILRRMGRLGEAEEQFQRAVELEPEAPEAQTLLARADYKAGRFEAAEQRLRAVIARAPNHAPARYLLGRLCKDTGRAEEAWRELGAARAFSFVGQFPDIGRLVAELTAEHPELLGGPR